MSPTDSNDGPNLIDDRAVHLANAHSPIFVKFIAYIENRLMQPAKALWPINLRESGTKNDTKLIAFSKTESEIVSSFDLPSNEIDFKDQHSLKAPDCKIVT